MGRERLKAVLLHGARQFPPVEHLLQRIWKTRPHDRVDASAWEDQYNSGH